MLNHVLNQAKLIKCTTSGTFELLTRNGPRKTIQFHESYHEIKQKIDTSIAPYVQTYTSENAGKTHRKYLNLDYWVFKNLLRCYRLELHSKSNLSILDMGTGAAYFPYICRILGHEAEGMDLTENKMYNDIVQALKISRYQKKIMPYTPLAINKKFDLITAFMICFNNHNQSDLWGIEEWNYLLNDLKHNHLNRNAHIYLSFNTEHRKELVEKQAELLSYFKGKGAKTTNITVEIDSSTYAF